MYKTRILSKSFAILFIAILFLKNQSFAMKSGTVENKEVANKEESINLSDYDYQVQFSDQETIQEIVNKYGLDDSYNTEEIIYIPVPEDAFTCDEENVKPADLFGEEYYIKKKGSKEAKGDLIRSSWYEYPSGSMSISESIAASYSFSNTASVSGGTDELKAEISAAYGFSLTKTTTITDTQSVKVKKGYKRNVKAYVNNMVYSFELWEDDVFSDDKIGSGTVKKPIGVVFQVGSNVKK